MRIFKFSYVLTLLAISFLWFSCGKENVNPTTEAAAQAPINDPVHQQANPIEVFCGMLSFQDMDVFQSTLNGLETETDHWDDAFVETNSHLNDEELATLEEETGFNDEQPLDDFEGQYDYQSLRSLINAEEVIWLDNDSLDDATDPNNHFIIDTYVQTLLNNEEEVKIGTSIFKFLEDGSYYEITDGDCQTLIDIKAGNIDPADAPNVIIHNPVETGGSRSSCRTNKRKRGFVSSSNRRIKWKIKVFNYPWQCGAKAKVKGYKKRRRRGWKKRRTRLDVCVDAIFCNSSGNLDPSLAGIACRTKRRRSLSVKVTGPCKTKSGAIKGFHAGHGLSKNSVLTF